MLTLLGVTYLIMGVGHLIRYERPVSGAFHVLLPDWGNAAIWGITGLLALIFAWRSHDGVGWIALYLAPMIRICSYLGSFLFYLVPGGVEGYATGWYGAAVFAPIVFCVLTCSGWPEERQHRNPEDDYPDELDAGTPHLGEH